MPAGSALGGFAFACLLFGVILSGAAIGLPFYGAGLFGGVFALVAAVLLLGGCAGLLAILAAVLGACSLRSPWGKVAAVGGSVVVVGDLAYLLWAFSLG